MKWSTSKKDVGIIYFASVVKYYCWRKDKTSAVGFFKMLWEPKLKKIIHTVLLWIKGVTIKGQIQDFEKGGGKNSRNVKNVTKAPYID